MLSFSPLRWRLPIDSLPQPTTFKINTLLTVSFSLLYRTFTVPIPDRINCEHSCMAAARSATIRIARRISLSLTCWHSLKIQLIEKEGINNITLTILKVQYSPCNECSELAHTESRRVCATETIEFIVSTNREGRTARVFPPPSLAVLRMQREKWPRLPVDRIESDPVWGERLIMNTRERLHCKSLNIRK